MAFFRRLGRKDRLASMFTLQQDILYLKNAFTLHYVDDLLPLIEKQLENYSAKILRINLDHLQKLDSAGVVALHYIREQMEQRGTQVFIEGGSENVQQILQTFDTHDLKKPTLVRPPGWFEVVGEKVIHFCTNTLKNFFFLISDVCYWSIVDLFRSKTFRKGEFVNQSILIGVQAVSIVIALAFLIGLVLALQSSAQLRQFGANVFIVDLTVIAMTREMGPLLTAIIVAGRSGSSIASEIATMKITEELDGLTTMALDPVRFIVVPKMYASIFTLPFLTTLANIFGIVGGMVIAFVYLDITPISFLNRMEDVLLFRDIITGIIKSLVFAGIIVITGSFFGFRAERGASEVGQVTTASVVVSISLVIVADSILGLIFY